MTRIANDVIRHQCNTARGVLRSLHRSIVRDEYREGDSLAVSYLTSVDSLLFLLNEIYPDKALAAQPESTGSRESGKGAAHG